MSKTFKCMYCEKRFDRAKLIAHIDKHHEELIPEGYDGARLVYDMVNKKTDSCGYCRVCHKPTGWNPKLAKYDVLCDDPKCKERLREEYKKNMLRVKGTYNILNDPEQQKIMLANRRISGVYKHSDGGKIQYTGEYERKFLEFMDLFMQMPSKDIISPGPTMEYYYNGVKHIYIPDFYIPSINCIIEVKDGGDNLNTKQSASMIASREKTLEKERIVTDRGEYNYIRLTNNQFEQMIDLFMTIKMKIMNGDDTKTIKINESYDEIITNECFLNESLAFSESDNADSLDIAKELLNKMKKIKYNHGSNWKLKSPDRVEETNSGDCHDQSLYIETKLKQSQIKCGRLFMIEYYGDEIYNAGTTHTLVWFIFNNKYYWIENAWMAMKGINGPFNDLDELKDYVFSKWKFLINMINFI